MAPRPVSTQVKSGGRRRAMKRILLVEDDPDIQIVTSLALGSFGRFAVKVCGSAREALEIAPAFKPDVILLDVVMPGMDGVRALRAFRRWPAFAHVPIIFMTARVQPHEVERYQELGSAAVIAKPFDPATLAETVRAIWNRHHA
jgi:CheY-like chemotaxis protein